MYREDRAPDAAEVARRIESTWKPYHRRLAGELARVRSEHGVAVLWDAHSIVSTAPRLFEGRLPDFNLGTAEGASCDANLAAALHSALQRQRGFTSVRDARFKGGYITRHYGRPAQGIHAVQMEMAQSTYMDEHCPFGLRADGVERVRAILREQLGICLAAPLPPVSGDAR
jgi:N-formylglutamate deformylase